MTMWLAVACATIGVIRTRLKRTVTCSWSFPTAGFTALPAPLATARYSPPGALGGGDASAVEGGFGSVTYSHAALSGGAAAVTGPCGQGSVTGAPSICVLTVARTSELVGSWLDARAAVRAPSRAAWLMVSR